MSGQERLRKNGTSDSCKHKVLDPSVHRLLGQSADQVSDLALSLALHSDNQGSAKAGGRLSGTLGDIALRCGATVRLNTQILGASYEETSEGIWKWVLEVQSRYKQNNPVNVEDA